MTDDLLGDLKSLLDRVDPTPTRLSAPPAFPPPGDHVPLDWCSDSAVATPTGMRGAGTSRSLRFTSDHTTIDLRLDTDLGVRALGLVHPPRGGSVLISWPDGGSTSGIDTVGWFRADPLPAGPLRFVVRQPGLPDLSTGWFVQ
ncbi:hypothetical protein ACFFQW_46720 [Umezawaea endophytica]|uniref:Uncharacterized protein n=1 Tax=Umezawaea endophytica TaxID=1654476 RepID=A0A9X2VW18_9PSEU|nr:hypothetical protein [Umezawaea endophytica]MCS7483069.1 hypothetical protein [Umezawaea endophytica]